MSEYSVTDYGIFNDGIGTIKTLNNNISTNVTILNECKTKLNNDSVFMGPICDSCVQGFSSSESKLSSISSAFTKISEYLVQTATAYKTGDTAASNEILKNDGGVLTTTAGKVNTGNANQDTIYNFLASKGYNTAAITGILANIQHESSFNPHALGDNGTSYGICQWHNSRWERLKSYCSQNGLDSTTLNGQLNYLVWELENNYTSVNNKIKSVPNTQQGAYDAAYEWTVHFEIPANKEQSGQNRGNTAVSKYWPTYSAAAQAAASTTPTTTPVAT